MSCKHLARYSTSILNNTSSISSSSLINRSYLLAIVQRQQTRSIYARGGSRESGKSSEDQVEQSAHSKSSKKNNNKNQIGLNKDNDHEDRYYVGKLERENSSTYAFDHDCDSMRPYIPGDHVSTRNGNCWKETDNLEVKPKAHHHGGK
eukprot:Nk52_evm20s152 gene=Nk52_evmTU20s152